MHGEEGGGYERTRTASVAAIIGTIQTPMSPQSQQEPCSRSCTRRRVWALGGDGGAPKSYSYSWRYSFHLGGMAQREGCEGRLIRSVMEYHSMRRETSVKAGDTTIHENSSTRCACRIQRSPPKKIFLMPRRELDIPTGFHTSLLGDSILSNESSGGGIFAELYYNWYCPFRRARERPYTSHSV